MSSWGKTFMERKMPFIIDCFYFCSALPVALCVVLAVWWIENVRWKWLDNKLKMHELYGGQGLQTR